MSTIHDEIDLSEVDIIDGDWLEYLCDPTVALDPSRRGFNGAIVKEDYYDEFLSVSDDFKEIIEQELEMLVSNSSDPLPRIIPEQELLDRIGFIEDPNSRFKEPITFDMCLKRIGLTQEDIK